MTSVPHVIRQMREEDVPEVVALREGVGSCDVASTYYTWLAVNPSGIFVAESNTGEIIGVCSSIIHKDDLAYLGLYAVKKKYQGQGIGFELWTKCMDHIGNRNACVNGWADTAEKYRTRGGFPILETNWKLSHYKATESISPDNLSEVPPLGVEIHRYDGKYLAAIIDYDCRLIGYERSKAVTLNCEEPDGVTFIAMSDLDCVGYGSIKMSSDGSPRVGPLYADAPTIAECLLKKLLQSTTGIERLDVKSNSDNVHFHALMRKVGCSMKAVALRLYRREAYRIDTGKVYAHFDTGFSVF